MVNIREYEHFQPEFYAPDKHDGMLQALDTELPFKPIATQNAVWVCGICGCTKRFNTWVHNHYGNIQFGHTPKNTPCTALTMVKHVERREELWRG
jgi:hypothetical protein